MILLEDLDHVTLLAGHGCLLNRRIRVTLRLSPAALPGEPTHVRAETVSSATGRRRAERGRLGAAPTRSGPRVERGAGAAPPAARSAGHRPARLERRRGELSGRPPERLGVRAGPQAAGLEAGEHEVAQRLPRPPPDGIHERVGERSRRFEDLATGLVLLHRRAVAVPGCGWGARPETLCTLALPARGSMRARRAS